jgi:anhydro-N-acetylmuramic acid kinase
MSILTAIGLMSGTSLDGVDAALVETDGERINRLGPVGYRPYSPDEQSLLRRALGEAAALSDRTARPGTLAEAEALVTRAHAEAIEDFVAKNKIEKSKVAIVGFHGQTVLHRPQARLTVQIGDGKTLAKRLGLPVAYDFRAADVAAGGEGAPLVPVYHRALAENLDVPKPVVVVNIGGVANLTFIDGARDPVAFDTGPGNAPIDDLMRARTGAAHDLDGKLAAKGQVEKSIVARVLADPFFAMPPPKSLDRAAFASLPLANLSIEDAAATATAVVAASIVRALDHLSKKPATIIIVGGGARNATLMSMLQQRLGATVLRGDDVGWSADAIEAQAFAYLAVRTLKGLPLTFPTTTGVPRAITGGVVAKPGSN